MDVQAILALISPAATAFAAMFVGVRWLMSAYAHHREADKQAMEAFIAGQIELITSRQDMTNGSVLELKTSEQLQNTDIASIRADVANLRGRLDGREETGG